MLQIDLEKNRIGESQETVIREIHSVLQYGPVGEFGWKRCVMGPDGTVYFPHGLVSSDGGRTVEKRGHMLSEIDMIPEACHIMEPGFFFMVTGLPEQTGAGKLTAKAVWSVDNLSTLITGSTQINLPPLGEKVIEKDGWDSCYFFGARNIARLKDGRLLASMYGSLEDDRVLTQDVSAGEETKYKKSTFTVVSDDLGKTWDYYAGVAKTLPGDPVGEGFNEPALERLHTGELMCVMRTGHFYPLYACWSGDEGKTWTQPVYMGLERACSPCLLRLRSGGLALAYGQRHPVGTSPYGFTGGVGDWMNHNMVRLAVSRDGRGRQWLDMTLGHNLGSTYVTLMETEPNVLLCQTDGCCWRVELAP